MKLTESSLEPEIESDKLSNSYETLLQNMSKFGLTQNQSKVYLHLSKNGSKSAPEISKSLKIPRTETYHLLNALQNKGITIANFGKPTKFQAVPFEKSILILVNNERNRIDELETKKERMVDLWQTIPFTDSNPDDEPDNKFQMLQGKSSILGKLKQLITSAEKEVLILGTEKDFMKFYHTDFVDELSNTKIDLKILTSCTKKSSYIFDEIPTKKIKRYQERPGENLCFLIKDDNEVIFFIRNIDTSDMLAVWTDSVTLLNSMKLLFNLIWQKSNFVNEADDLASEQYGYDHRIREIEQERVILDVLQKYITKMKSKPKKK